MAPVRFPQQLNVRDALPRSAISAFSSLPYTTKSNGMRAREGRQRDGPEEETRVAAAVCQSP